ncbi:MAG: benzoate/H(+) symporter BenE family transporter [Actinomycetota bacterium]
MNLPEESGTANLSTMKGIIVNTRNLKEAFSWTALFSGLLVVFVSTTGPIAILYQAAEAGNLSAEITNSWLFAVFLGSGLFGLILSLRFGIPIVGSWASTTTALLVTGLVDHNFSDVIGAYFGASILLMIVGFTGAFDRIIRAIPHSIIMAMLAGVLFLFGLKIFTSTRVNPLLGFAMILIFVFGRTFKWRAPVLAAFLIGLAIALIQKKVNLPKLDFSVTSPVWTSPTFSAGSFFTLTIPIFLMVMTTQNAPGIALLKAVNYRPPINQIVHFGGTLSLLGAGFGGAGVNLSAMTATIAISPDSDPNPQTRYFAGVSSGIAYVIAALFAGIFSALYGAFPIELTAILAGLALLPVITNALSEAIERRDYRESAIFTFLVTASGVSGFNIGAPFWGLLTGLAIHKISEIRASR